MHADLKEESRRDTSRDAEIEVAFSHFLLRSEYLKETGIPTGDLALLKQEDQDTLATMVVLTLLPNVRTLALPASWHRFYDTNNRGYVGAKLLWALLDSIVKRANISIDGIARFTPQPGLAKLETLLPIHDTGYESRAGLQTFAPFLSLPHVRKFKTKGVVAMDDTYTGKPFATRYDTFGTSLEEAHLEGACIDHVTIAKFLEPCKMLKKFTFSFETKWHGCGHYWDAGLFMQAVERSIGDTLEEMNVGILKCYGGTGTGVVSLKGFKKLKVLKIQVSLLDGPPVGGKIHQDWDYKSSGRTPHGDSLIPAFVNLLPQSIETAVFEFEAAANIVAPPHVTILKSLTRYFDIEILRNKLLPNLGNLVIKSQLHSDVYESASHWRDYINSKHRGHCLIGIECLTGRRRVAYG